MAKAIIDVDKELNPQTVKRTLTVEDDHLLACVRNFFDFVEASKIARHRTFKTLTIRLARLAVNSFLEDIELVLRTLAEFADEAKP
jgi:EKC/KEOPS complex subunit PCC1/LAGE3